ncbi:MAG: hypothetical protein UY27_C0009G0011 [Candidatus Gottesmanbacteria bacterium GW2011_GWA1_48_13]|uniref:Uncharacterized protein n=1 Tax=Candidatus Gottesmanbacteria bacterium GW2011_GWA1_48_13 TaxID=1618439 RepID=A0A0G1WZL0_9BACT|nr:MAG: hypothetical protein UY27_C0009G0011 [Candidatus Gottesmanbacteria bacterium GW2011_GWA1_48_13]
MARLQISINGKSGQSLVEFLVAMGIAAILFPALATGLIASREGSVQEGERTEAVAALTEGKEAVRIVRDAGWVNIAANGTFHPVVNGATWALAAGTETIGDLTRAMVISDVYRDAAGNIASAGTLDPSTKRVDIRVSWNVLFPSVVSETLYLTRHKMAVVVQTTEADFAAGTNTRTVVTNTGGGEVTLGAGGRADWCAPNLSITPLDLPKSGVANAISAIVGRVFAGTGDNASGVSFANVNIGNTNPPTASILGTFDGYKTNDIFGEADYVYFATDNNFKEIVIINLASSPYAEAGYFNAPGNGNGHSVVVAGTTGYMTTGDKLYTFDVSVKSGSRPALGSVTLAAEGKSISVVSGYAFIAIDSSSTQLQIVDVSSPNTPTVVGSATVTGGEGKDVFVNESGTRAYLVTEASLTSREFFMIDVSTKIGSRPTVGNYDTAGMDPKGVTVVPGNRAIVVGTGSEEYQVINIGNEASPVRCGGLSIDTGINGVSSVLEADGDAYSYIITGDTASELKIIEGGPGGQAGNSGIFESATIDAAASSAWNRFDTTVITPSQTTVRYQVASSDAIGGSCDVTFAFVGPDGTSGTYFTTPGTIPFSSDEPGYHNPGACFRYRLYLDSTDPAAAPIVEDVTVNYSP